MRGTKLTAWRIPPIWRDLQRGSFDVPPGSTVPQNQEKLLRATRDVLNSIARDVQTGLLETVGIESELSTDDDLCSMRLILPEATDAEFIARAIDAENVEAWIDSNGKVHVVINPWYSTKDVDQTVLSTTKVIHVLLGLHATDSAQPKTLKQKLLAGVREVMLIQKKAAKKSD